MKTIYLKVEVPDDAEVIDVTAKTKDVSDGIGYYRPTQLHIPTDEEIDTEMRSNYPANNVKGIVSGEGAIGFIKGAKWLKSKLQ